MSEWWRSPATFAGGSLAGALILAVYLGLLASDHATRPAPFAETQPQPTRSAIVAAETVSDSKPLAPAAARPAPAVAAATCPTKPLAMQRDAQDGRFQLDAVLASNSPAQPGAYLAVAREAAQDGRLRDAEVALLAACHLTERASGSQSVPLADLKTELGQEYVVLAAEAADDQQRQLLLQRAATLLTESANAYAAALGRESSKARMAQQRLASLREPGILHAGRGALSGPNTNVMGAARESAEAHEPLGAGDSCSGSAARQLICSDPELAQMESDMRRLHAQASSVTRDARGMRQRDSHALAVRDSGCQDKACLKRWFAQRRSQLLAEF